MVIARYVRSDSTELFSWIGSLTSGTTSIAMKLIPVDVFNISSLNPRLTGMKPSGGVSLSAFSQFQGKTKIGLSRDCPRGRQNTPPRLWECVYVISGVLELKTILLFFSKSRSQLFCKLSTFHQLTSWRQTGYRPLVVVRQPNAYYVSYAGSRPLPVLTRGGVSPHPAKFPPNDLPLVSQSITY